MFDYWEAAVKPKFKRLSYIFLSHMQVMKIYFWLTMAFIIDALTQLEDIMNSRTLHEIDVFKVPEWAKEAVFYQIMTETVCQWQSRPQPEEIHSLGVATLSLITTLVETCKASSIIWMI